MKAVFLDYKTMGSGLDLDCLRAIVDELVIYDGTSDADLAERIHDTDIVYTNKMQLTAEVLQDAPKLRFIGLTATGSDNVDLDCARQHGIIVANIRNYCTASVAEHVFGALLMLTHSLPQYGASVADGEWQESSMPFLLNHPIRELSAMTLGIVGHGTLGQGVADIGRAFGMQVLVAARPGATTIPDGRHAFEDVLAGADAISLHCPLNRETRNLMSAEQFGQMKKGAFLVNTARGGLVDSAALVKALETGHLAGASVDVLPHEPPVDGDPLLDYTGRNLIVTPHIAWASDEARQNAIDELAANTRAFLAGESRNHIT